MQTAPNLTEAPFFVVGASRSGTTMLRLVLNEHSRLHVPNEIKYMNRLPLGAGDTRWSTPDGVIFNQFVDYFFEKRADVFEGIDIDSLKAEIREYPADYRTPYVCAMNALSEAEGKVRWGEKTPNNLFYADVLIEMFPDARFIHLVRDPRAVVNSMNSIRYYTDNVAFNARNWHQSAVDGYELLCRSVPEAQRMVIRYEELVSNPEEHVRDICDFLGEEFEPQMLEFYRNTERNMPVIRTPSIMQPVDQKNAEKWRHELTESQIATIESICEKPMRLFGYEPTGLTQSGRQRGVTAMSLAYWRWQRLRNARARTFEVKSSPFGRLRRAAAGSSGRGAAAS